MILLLFVLVFQSDILNNNYKAITNPGEAHGLKYNTDEDDILNRFKILKDIIFRWENHRSCLIGLNSSYYSAPAGVWTEHCRNRSMRLLWQDVISTMSTLAPLCEKVMSEIVQISARYMRRSKWRTVIAPSSSLTISEIRDFLQENQTDRNDISAVCRTNSGCRGLNDTRLCSATAIILRSNFTDTCFLITRLAPRCVYWDFIEVISINCSIATAIRGVERFLCFSTLFEAAMRVAILQWLRGQTILKRGTERVSMHLLKPHS